ncbi:MAG: helix-turn-helix domain-containing protein [Saccharothrix sp.]|nr:helix-turn-helix domain-containing protein [Saccharothrix sp.]
METAHAEPGAGARRPTLPATLLGRELLRLREAQGLSLRRLARLLGMTAHSGLVDYERGLRIPPRDLMSAYVRVLSPEDDHLMGLYRRALADRANLRVATAPEPSPPGQPHGQAAQTARLTALADALEDVALRLRDIAETLCAMAEPTGR